MPTQEIELAMITTDDNESVEDNTYCHIRAGAGGGGGSMDEVLQYPLRILFDLRNFRRYWKLVSILRYTD